MPGRRTAPGASHPDLELRQVRQALAVADQGTVAGAAAFLKVSQSSLSRSLAALEKRLGATLFRRGPEGLVPTETGNLFLQRARDLATAADDLDRLIARNPSLHVGRLVVGIGSTGAEPAVARAAARFLAEMPGTTLELRSGLRNDLLPPLKQGELDLLIADGHFVPPDRDLEAQDLPGLPLLVMVRRGHPLASRPRFEMVEAFVHPVLAPGRVQPKVLDGLLQEQGRAREPLARTRPMPAVVSSSVGMLEQLLQSSDVVSAATPELARPLIERGHAVPLAAPAWLRSPYALIRLRGRAPNPAAEPFRRLFLAAHEAELAETQPLIAGWLAAGPSSGDRPPG